MSRYREWSMECKVYVGNLGSGAAKHEIESAFGKYGPLRNVWVARNPAGFAFVEYEDPRDAEDAVRALDGMRVCGSRVRVEMSHGRARRGSGHRDPPPSQRYNRYDSGRSLYRARSPSPRRKYTRSESRSRSRSQSFRRSFSRSLSRERR